MRPVYAVIFSLAVTAGGCGGETPPSDTLSEADLNATCVDLYDAVEAFDSLPRPLSDDQAARLATLNERIDNECG